MNGKSGTETGIQKTPRLRLTRPAAGRFPTDKREAKMKKTPAFSIAENY